MTNKYLGNDNYGNPKQIYINKLSAMTEKELFTETRQKILLSAYANNNPRSDYHWQVDATYDEWGKRDKPSKYKEAWEAEYLSAKG